MPDFKLQINLHLAHLVVSCNATKLWQMFGKCLSLSGVTGDVIRTLAGAGVGEVKMPATDTISAAGPCRVDAILENPGVLATAADVSGTWKLGSHLLDHKYECLCMYCPLRPFSLGTSS